MRKIYNIFILIFILFCWSCTEPLTEKYLDLSEEANSFFPESNNLTLISESGDSVNISLAIDTRYYKDYLQKDEIQGDIVEKIEHRKVIYSSLEVEYIMECYTLKHNLNIWEIFEIKFTNKINNETAQYGFALEDATDLFYSLAWQEKFIINGKEFEDVYLPESKTEYKTILLKKEKGVCAFLLNAELWYFK